MQTVVLQQYDEWLADHLEELLSQYPGQVVAIHQDQVVFVGDSEVDAYRWSREANLEPMPLVFRVPREEDIHSILASR
jgi:hypothetical protein